MGTAIYKIDGISIKVSYNQKAITSLSIRMDTDFGGESEKSPLSELVKKELEEYFSGRRHAFTFPMELNGTEFQKKVWQALCSIPYGETRSYKDIAIAVGSPRGFRSVGGANHVNPISIAVP
ncbi:MAG: methylated-DNA--[protein]-cysteine S-methyltransferase [Oscillospiraceae bacterium]